MKQMDIFEMLYPEFRFRRPIRLVELFAGYGSQSLALSYLHADYESWKICEWNYKSFHAYRLMHREPLIDRASSMTDRQLEDFILSRGVSSDWNKAMTAGEIKRLPLAKKKQIVDDIFSTRNLVDISKVHGLDLEIEKEKERKHDYLFTYSFPCQDLSLAGHRKGMGKGSGTRSGLLWEFERIMKELADLKERPEVLLMENVP